MSNGEYGSVEPAAAARRHARPTRRSASRRLGQRGFVGHELESPGFLDLTLPRSLAAEDTLPFTLVDDNTGAEPFVFDAPLRLRRG